jgi:hypothetical protein
VAFALLDLYRMLCHDGKRAARFGRDKLPERRQSQNLVWHTARPQTARLARPESSKGRGSMPRVFAGRGEIGV